MNGAGNDFVVIDNRGGGISLTAADIVRVCDRRRGVGADGLILVESAEGHDCFMRFYNSDGSEERMCGNGAACTAAFAAAAGMGEAGGGRTRVCVLTGSGAVRARVVSAGTPARFRSEMEMMDAVDLRLDVRVAVARIPRSLHFMVVGTRHAVVPVDDAGVLTGKEINELGRTVRWDAAFAPQGANVNCASIDGEGRIHIRTYEKGVEAETLACGTGSIAAAVAFAHAGRCESPATVVQSSRDELRVGFRLTPTGATGVTLEGPAEVNFEGAIDI
jgi:diaminopimelate epimerase